MGVSKNNGTPKWMVKIMENPIKMDDLGYIPPFLETPIYTPKSIVSRNKIRIVTLIHFMQHIIYDYKIYFHVRIGGYVLFLVACKIRSKIWQVNIELKFWPKDTVHKQIWLTNHQGCF